MSEAHGVAAGIGGRSAPDATTRSTHLHRTGRPGSGQRVAIRRRARGSGLRVQGRPRALQRGGTGRRARRARPRLRGLPRPEDQRHPEAGGRRRSVGRRDRCAVHHGPQQWGPGHGPRGRRPPRGTNAYGARGDRPDQPGRRGPAATSASTAVCGRSGQGDGRLWRPRRERPVSSWGPAEVAAVRAAASRPVPRHAGDQAGRRGCRPTNDGPGPPRQAIDAGADMLVVGRPVTAAPDPRSALEAISLEIASDRSNDAGGHGMNPSRDARALRGARRAATRSLQALERTALRRVRPDGARPVPPGHRRATRPRARLPVPRSAEATIVLGPAMGGVLIGHEIARYLAIPMIYSERVQDASDAAPRFPARRR